MEKKKIIEFKNITKDFEGQVVLKGIDLDIYENEFVTLLGPSGCGKTTLLRILGGFLEPSGGQVIFDGQDTKGKSTIEMNKMGIARTFQNIRLFNELSVEDNVKIGMHNEITYTTLAGILKTPNYYKQEKTAHDKAIELLKIFNLDKFANVKSKNLPYGAQRRLEIARALATNPKLLLLDEPAAGMNPTETEELMKTIRFIRDKFDIAVLLIEHDMKLVMGVCEKITVLNFGQVLMSGTPQEVQNDPEVIKAYIGD